MTNTFQRSPAKRRRRERESFSRQKRRWDCKFSYFVAYCVFLICFCVLIYTFFTLSQEKSVLPQQKKDDQKTVDSALIKAIESVPNLNAYLGARFSLKDGVKPHELVF